MPILISDISSFTTLCKASLLDMDTFVQLPHDFVTTDVLFHQDFANASESEKYPMKNKLRVLSLSGEEVSKVKSINQNHPCLTINDCFSFVLAMLVADCILVTENSILHELAKRSNLEVRSFSWLLNEINKFIQIT
jgi:hypothetical protein